MHDPRAVVVVWYFDFLNNNWLVVVWVRLLELPIWGRLVCITGSMREYMTQGGLLGFGFFVEIHHVASSVLQLVEKCMYLTPWSLEPGFDTN